MRVGKCLYLVSGSKVYPAVEYIWLVKLLALALILQTHPKIPV